jgi:3-oxoacyl-[acyl-carrier protein] reductase
MIYPDLENKIILVTGASRGIGKSIVMALAKQKANIVINYRSKEEDKLPENIELLVDELKSLGASSVHPLEFDLLEVNKMQEKLKAFTKEVGTITGLVNNAGISKDQLILKLKKDDLDNIIDINLKGSILLTSTLSRSFLRGENVSVVNISSVVGLMGNSSQVSYAASKAGLIGFTKSLAKELASKNIRANAVCPGFIETQMTQSLDEKVKESYLSSIPLKKMGSGEDVSNLVSFLLSSASGYITGETIKIDGGLYI